MNRTKTLNRNSVKIINTRMKQLNAMMMRNRLRKNKNSAKLSFKSLTHEIMHSVPWRSAILYKK